MSDTHTATGLRAGLGRHGFSLPSWSAQKRGRKACGTFERKLLVLMPKAAGRGGGLLGGNGIPCGEKARSWPGPGGVACILPGGAQGWPCLSHGLCLLSLFSQASGRKRGLGALCPSPGAPGTQAWEPPGLHTAPRYLGWLLQELPLGSEGRGQAWEEAPLSPSHHEHTHSQLRPRHPPAEAENPTGPESSRLSIFHPQSRPPPEPLCPAHLPPGLLTEQQVGGC